MRIIELLAAFAVMVTGCATGFVETTTFGATFSSGASALILTVEVSAVAHEPFEHETSRPTPQLSMPYQVDRHPRNYLGIAATASVGMEWARKPGTTALAALGVDYLPFLGPWGGTVGLGVQVAYASGAFHGFHAVAPRLWVAVPVGRLAGAPLAVGLMLRGQIGLDGASGAGPSIVVSRVAL